MKVLMIAPQPFFQPRGTPFSVLHRLRALSKLGHHIDLVTYPIGQDVAIENVNIIRAAPVPFIKNIAIGPSLPKIFLDITLYRKAVQQLRSKKYDLLHTHEEAGFFGIRLSRKYNLLHLYDMHSSLPQQLSNFKFSKSKALLAVFETLERKTIESAQAVITICPELRDYVDGRFPGKFNKLIENVADNSAVFEEKPDPEKLRQSFNINGDAIVLYAGTLESYQGLELLINAGKKVVDKRKDVKFLVVGGKPAQVDHYRTLAAEQGIADQFIFTGQRPPEEIPVFMNMADVLVSPRIDGTNTPLKVYSYLRSGIPIVATEILTHTQVLNSQVSALAKPVPDAFADSIIQVLGDDDYSKGLIESAQKLADAEYSYDAYVKKTSETYEYMKEILIKRSSN